MRTLLNIILMIMCLQLKVFSQPEKINLATKVDSAMGNKNGKGIAFETGFWNDILLKSNKENKIIFIYLHIPGCKPCKWMEENVFISDSVGIFYNRNFINVNVLDDGKRGLGDFLENKYKMENGFPAYCFVNPQGKAVAKGFGKKTLKEFLLLGNYILSLDRKQKENSDIDTNQRTK